MAGRHKVAPLSVENILIRNKKSDTCKSKVEISEIYVCDLHDTEEYSKQVE